MGTECGVVGVDAGWIFKDAVLTIALIGPIGGLVNGIRLKWTPRTWTLRGTEAPGP